MPSKAQIKARKAFAKKYAKRKGLLKKQTAKAKRELARADKKGYMPNVKGYQVCSKCLKKKVGSRQAWFADFTGQKRLCNACIDKLRKAKKS